jgi:hypothetical protein
MRRLTDLWPRPWLNRVRLWRSRNRNDSTGTRSTRTVPESREGKQAIGVTWHGSDQELLSLHEAIVHNCSCSGLLGADSACGAHAMLLDQYLVGHLLYIYRSRERFVREEFTSAVGA